ncbi:hypothetical protein F3J45_17395 [Pantoea sp. Ap-967]|nr:hypothetical protein [Pantoea sp. Ap-967]
MLPAFMAGFFCLAYKRRIPPVGAGLPREAGDAVRGTAFAGVRGASPLLQKYKLNQIVTIRSIGAQFAMCPFTK